MPENMDIDGMRSSMWRDGEQYSIFKVNRHSAKLERMILHFSAFRQPLIRFQPSKCGYLILELISAVLASLW